MASTSLHTKIFIGMAVGIAAGTILQYSGLSREAIDGILLYVRPVGDIFLRMLFMMVLPLILSALALGITEVGDIRRVGRLGLKTLIFTLVISAVSVLIGITMANMFQPGSGISAENRATLEERYAPQTQALEKSVGTVRSRSIGEILSSIVPKNPFEEITHAFDPGWQGGGILAIMFFALMLGIGLILADSEKVATFRKFLEGLYEVVMRIIGLGMKLAPFGVAALLCVLTATMGFSIIVVLSKFVVVVLAALLIHQMVTYPLLIKFVAKRDPLAFFRDLREVMLTAFSTSSSNATLPTAIRVSLEKLKLPKDITHFVLTLGSTANQNGTALYEGITVLFIAQCFGVDLSISQQILVVLLAILGGVGTAGVPSGSLPVIMMILLSIGLPAESIAIVYGVDRFLDMCRTVLNVTGDIVVAACVSRMKV